MIKKHLYLAVIYESLLTLSFGNLLLVLLLFERPFPYRDLCFVFEQRLELMALIFTVPHRAWGQLLETDYTVH